MKNPTINQIFTQWIDLKKPLITKQTYRTYLGFYNNHIAPAFGVRAINTTNYADYQKFANNLLEAGKKPKTVKNILDVLNGLYDLAKKNEWYKGETFPAMVELPKFDNKFYVSIPKETQLAYLRAITSFQEPIYKDIFLFLLHGRRVNEVLDLEWEYLDLNEKILYLPSTRNKARKNLSFMLTDKLVEALRPYQEQAINEQGTIFLKGHVFKNPLTQKRYANITKPWKRLLKRANLPHMKLHGIRHLVGTYLINELNIPIEQVSIMLGHSSIEITKRYYNPKPSISRDCTQSLFDSIKPKTQEYIEDLDESIKLGDLVKHEVLKNRECKKVAK